MIFLLIFALLLSFFGFVPSKTFAQEDNQFITIVNPIRISYYTPNPVESVRTQYSIVAQHDLSATWLLTYDAISHDGVFSVMRGMDKIQEFGILLEVTPEFAKASGVSYHETGSWHHSNSVLLSGYTQEERVQLINTVFEKFRSRFGYYPTSVGSWWTDSFSQSYMQEKYGITANLGVADQFSTDGYQVWGQYWSTPFYPSKYHAGVPASDVNAKLDIVTIQWAPRDPLNGYYSSLYSSQDYKTGEVNQKTDYLEKLLNLYAGKHGNQFGQITVGLEGDLAADIYRGEFTNQMRVVKQLRDTNEFRVINMKEFSEWYRANFPDLSPPHLIVADDLLGEKSKVIWYQSPRYRVGLVQGNGGSEVTKVIDLRTYHSDLKEPYYESPNRENTLSIYVPSVFDEVNKLDDIWKLPFGRITSIDGDNNEVTVNFGSEDSITLRPKEIFIKNKQIALPEILKAHPAVKTVKTNSGWEIFPQVTWIVPKDGVVIKALTVEATHFLKQKKVFIVLGAITVLSFVLSAFVLKLRATFTIKLFAVMTVFSPLYVGGFYWYSVNTSLYSVSQGEIDVLFHLSVLPQGKVLVYNNECLQCSWYTERKPAVFANKRGYVQKYGKHPIIYNSSVFKAQTRLEAKQEFLKSKAKYIYLSKVEDYIEKTPFSPGDLGIEKIYSNANAELWQVVEHKK